MLHVEHFGFHALLGDVFKHDLASDATLGSGEGEVEPTAPAPITASFGGLTVVPHDG